MSLVPVKGDKRKWSFVRPVDFVCPQSGGDTKRSKIAGLPEEKQTQSDDQVNEDLIVDFTAQAKLSKRRASPIGLFLINKNFSSVQDIVDIFRQVDVTDYVGYKAWVVDTLIAAASSQLVDQNGEFKKWFHYIPRSLFVMIPGLKEFPRSLGIALSEVLPEQARHLYRIIEQIADHQEEYLHHNTTYRNKEQRLHIVVISTCMCSIIKHLPPVLNASNDRKGHRTVLTRVRTLSEFRYSDYISNTMSKCDLVNLFVHVISACPTSMDYAKRFVGYLNNAIWYSDIFENIEDTETLDWDSICWAAGYHKPKIVKKDLKPYTSDEVKAIQDTPMTPMEEMIVSLLTGPALRKVGIRHLLVEDVYDNASGMPRNFAECSEKFGKKREFRVDTNIMAALGKYMPTHAFLCRFLFPQFPDIECDDPISDVTIDGIVAGLFKKAGVVFHGMHLFRHWKITSLVESGAPLEAASVWIGHESIATTYKHYYKPGQATIDNHIDKITHTALYKLKKDSNPSESSARTDLLHSSAIHQWTTAFHDHLDCVGCPVGQFWRIHEEFCKIEPFPE
jgi:integrase